MMNNKNKNGNSQRRYGRSDADQKARSQSQYARYMAQGRDAAAHGDKVEAERSFQYAEHYLRVLNNGRDQTPAVPKEIAAAEDGEVFGAFPSSAPLDEGEAEPCRAPKQKRRARTPKLVGEVETLPEGTVSESGSRPLRTRRKADAQTGEK